MDLLLECIASGVYVHFSPLLSTLLRRLGGSLPHFGVQKEKQTAFHPILAISLWIVRKGDRQACCTG